MYTPKNVRQCSLTLLAMAGVAAGGAVPAQDLGDAILEEIIVTGTKRAGGVEIQQAPVAISAYDENQLDAMNFHSLSQLGFDAPSVQLEDLGTQRGVANFSIRGLGINSSIPSIDPTVGVFMDGMYYGINGGVVLDMFDLESVEILRGPQGILFGRNVTGGAVLLNTTRPTDEFRLNTRLAMESGDNLYVSAVATGPLSNRVGWKLAAYQNQDDGWFTNLATGKRFGKADTTILRGALEFDINDGFDIIVRLESGDSEGDGPAARNRGCVTVAVPGLCAGQYTLEGFEFAIDEEGFYDSQWLNAIVEASWDVNFGDGEVKNILGYRQFESSALSDVDATPAFLFHAPAYTDQDQISNELRYSGGWDSIYLTAGLYYFSQSLTYFENRQIPPLGYPPPGITGGGFQDHRTIGLYAQADFLLSDTIVLNLGGRFTREDKDANIASIPLSAVNQCVFPTGCQTYDFNDSRDWDNFSPKIGMQFMPDEDTQLYLFWTKGFRSGGFNMRHTGVGTPNQAFDEEEQRSFEVGLKKDFAGGRVRANLAAYRNQIDNLQREINLADPVTAVTQRILNTADATIKGIDAEFTAVLSDHLVVKANLGYVDGGYNRVRQDLTGDGVIDGADLALKIPRLAPWSYGGQIIYDRDTRWGTFTAQAGGYRRDAAYYTDNNLGKLREIDYFDARIGMGFLDDSLTFSVYGKNLKDQPTIGGDTQLPFFPGATFSPLNKGRIWGAEVRYIYE
jgi:iron complex outermembrane receptor protein